MFDATDSVTPSDATTSAIVASNSEQWPAGPYVIRTHPLPVLPPAELETVTGIAHAPDTLDETWLLPPPAPDEWLEALPLPPAPPPRYPAPPPGPPRFAVPSVAASPSPPIQVVP